MFALQHFVGGIDDGGGFIGIQQAQILIDFGGSAFGQRQRLD